MEMPYLLQKHQIGVERLDAMPQVVDFQTLLCPKPTHPLVDVVGRHAKMLAFFSDGSEPDAGSFHVDSKNRGSSSTASAFEGEKHKSAASCQGNQRYCRCSRSASLTGIVAGKVRPKTCSVL